MKIKLAQIKHAIPFTKELSKASTINIQASLNIVKGLKELVDIETMINNKIQEIISEFGKKDAEGKPVINADNSIEISQEGVQKYNDLLSEEIELEPRINVNEITSSLTPEMIIVLEGWFLAVNE